MSSWTNFFKEAGIPLAAAKSYAGIFEDNRITRDMLLDLSKEILSDMGVKVMGDIICILKHAKKEVRKKESSSNDGGQVSFGGPLAHSTTTGHSDTVSTTSAAGRKAKAGGSTLGDTPRDNWGHRVTPPPTFVFGDQADKGVLQLEPEMIARTSPIIPALRSDQMLPEPSLLRQPEYYTKKVTVEPSSRYDSVGENYSTAAYERSKQQKRPATMYSDELDEYSPSKQPRVVVLPGERGQEMYTATALQRAAAIAAATASIVAHVNPEDESPISQINRQILEAAGFVPSVREKVTSSSSIFSRLDGDGPPSSSHLSSPPSTSQGPQLRSPSPPPARVAVDTSKVRTIKLGRDPKQSVSSSASDLKVTAKTRKPSLPGRVSDRLVGKERERSSTVPKMTRGIASQDVTTAATKVPKSSRVTDRLGKVEKITSLRSSERHAKELSGLHSSASAKPVTIKHRLGDKDKAQSVVSSSSTVRRASRSSKERRMPKSMVADEYDYQTQRQMDVRMRLEKKEREKAARRGGPLGGRLEKHNIFGRLE